MIREKCREDLTKLLVEFDVDDTFLEPMLVSVELYMTAYSAAMVVLEEISQPREYDVQFIHTLAVALMGNIQIVVQAQPQGLSVADPLLVKKLQEMHGT